MFNSGKNQIEFPTEQPVNGNFNRPAPNEKLDVSPPGFSWWRAAPRGELNYRLRIEEESGKLVYESENLTDPVDVPNKVLPAGNYRWFVDALDKNGSIIGTRPSQVFSIVENALELPWVDPAELLSRVPKEHPRLLFPNSKLDEIKATLDGTRSAAYNDLKKVADEALKLHLMEEPDFDKYSRETEYPARRTAYRASYQEFTRIYNQGMVPLAMMYKLSGEEKYGLAAKKHLLNIIEWEIDGVSSLEEGFDEIGMRIARTAAQGYDWVYDLLSEDERQATKQMLLNRGDQMLSRLQEKDFLNKSAYSHDGRLPGYLVEFSITLAEEERAQVWMDYAMRALLTVFPHWGGKDGGWAEGINYVLSYNDRFITPLQSLYAATGYDLWKMSYFRNMRNFLVYCVSPIGEIAPFGDAEHLSISTRADDIYAIMKFHALNYEDPITRWWIEELERDKATPSRFGAMHRIIHEDNIISEKPKSLDPDMAFKSIGWAALHSDILNPKNDLMFLFKSSPYGSVSHSHADQNSFAIMKGGKALANPSGARYPQHQSPFHFEYTNLTIAHNALMINGEGQIDRDASANGKIVDFKSTKHIGYVAGDAQKSYRDRLSAYVRHAVMIRPSVILIIDDIEAHGPVSIDWLMHGREKMIVDSENHIIISTRFEEEMKTQLITSEKIDFALTNEWLFDPRKDYPMVTAERPAKEWHLTASVQGKSNKRRIAALMIIKENGYYPECNVSIKDGVVNIDGRFEDDNWNGIININTDEYTGSLLELNYVSSSGEVETIKILDL